MHIFFYRVQDEADSASEGEIEVIAPVESKESEMAANEEEQVNVRKETLEKSDQKEKLPKLPKKKRRSQEEGETNILKTVSILHSC